MSGCHITHELVKALNAAGWEFVGARALGTWHLAGFDYNSVGDMLDDMALGQDVYAIFSDGKVQTWVMFIPSNGEDVVSDYACSHDTFMAAVDAFLDTLG